MKWHKMYIISFEMKYKVIQNENIHVNTLWKPAHCLFEGKKRSSWKSRTNAKLTWAEKDKTSVFITPTKASVILRNSFLPLSKPSAISSRCARGKWSQGCSSLQYSFFWDQWLLKGHSRLTEDNNPMGKPPFTVSSLSLILSFLQWHTMNPLATRTQRILWRGERANGEDLRRSWVGNWLPECHGYTVWRLHTWFAFPTSRRELFRDLWFVFFAWFQPLG